MYIPGTLLLWMAFLVGLTSTVAYALSIRDPQRWRPYDFSEDVRFLEKGFTFICF